MSNSQTVTVKATESNNKPTVIPCKVCNEFTTKDVESNVQQCEHCHKFF